MGVTLRQLNRSTLARQLLLERVDMPVGDAVHRIVAVQAQEPASPYVALWNRLRGFEPSELDAAFAGGVVVKATLMRITLHAVHATDYTAFHEAMLPTLRAARLHDRRYRSTGLTTADADALVPHVVEHATEPRTKTDMEALLADRLGGPPERGVWWALRTFAPLTHAPTGAPWSFGRHAAYRAAPTHPERQDTDLALQHLVVRYLQGFGPATAEDIAQFALQQRPRVREAIAALGEQLSRLEGPDGVTLVDVPGAPLPDGDVPAPPRLMAMWDSTLLAYADRTRVVPAEYRTWVLRRNGDSLPTLLVDGQVAGVWRPVDGGIEATAFRPLDDETWSGLAGEAAALLDFLADRDPAVYARYGHWWATLPAAEVRVLTR